MYLQCTALALRKIANIKPNLFTIFRFVNAPIFYSGTIRLNFEVVNITNIGA
jgi:hypothetical protein